MGILVQLSSSYPQVTTPACCAVRTRDPGRVSQSQSVGSPGPPPTATRLASGWEAPTKSPSTGLSLLKHPPAPPQQVPPRPALPARGRGQAQLFASAWAQQSCGAPSQPRQLLGNLQCLSREPHLTTSHPEVVPPPIPASALQVGPRSCSSNPCDPGPVPWPRLRCFRPHHPSPALFCPPVSRDLPCDAPTQAGFPSVTRRMPWPVFPWEPSSWRGC